MAASPSPLKVSAKTVILLSVDDRLGETVLRKDSIRAAWRGQPECEKCGIRHLALFADLRESDFEGIHVPIEDLEFPGGSTLYNVGDPGQAVFTVRTGVVKLIQYLPNGSYRIVRLLTQGGTAGLEATIGEPYGHSAVAVRETLVCRIPSATVDQLRTKNPDLCKRLMQRWHDSVQQADDWLTRLSTGSAKSRMARLFLYLMGDTCDPTCQIFGRNDMAAILGITTETASRLVAEFSRDRVVAPLAANRFMCDQRKLEEIALN